MAPKKAWEAKDGTVFVEREDGGREIIRDVGGERKLFETERREDESHEDESRDDD
jgi:hypothetical protein